MDLTDAQLKNESVELEPAYYPPGCQNIDLSLQRNVYKIKYGRTYTHVFRDVKILSIVFKGGDLTVEYEIPSEAR